MRKKKKYRTHCDSGFREPPSQLKKILKLGRRPIDFKDSSQGEPL